MSISKGIYIIDDFLSDFLLNSFLKDDSEFIEQPMKGKSFWVRVPSEQFVKYVIEKIEKIENQKIVNLLSFFREAKKNQDDDWRIHNDSIILGQQPDRAIVLFMESKESAELNGTAFWEHKIHGDVYNGYGNDDFDKILKEESEKLESWNLKSVVGYKQNRLLSYPCRYFHSKYPKEFNDPRRVFVMFYKYK